MGWHEYSERVACVWDGSTGAWKGSYEVPASGLWNVVDGGGRADSEGGAWKRQARCYLWYVVIHPPCNLNVAATDADRNGTGLQVLELGTIIDGLDMSSMVRI